MENNLITQSIEIVGLAALARMLGVTYQAIRKWERNGKLPRTEWTGETNYAEIIEQATGGKVCKAALLSVHGKNHGFIFKGCQLLQSTEIETTEIRGANCHDTPL